MLQTTPYMNYCVLHGVQNAAQGFVRIDESPKNISFTLCLENLPTEIPLRLLLLSCGEEGAALQLGLLPPAAHGRLSLTQTRPAIDLQLWDAIALAEDWPSGSLVAAGWLRSSTGPVWRLKEAAAQFLAVPVE